MLDKPWDYVVDPTKHLCYQPVVYFTKWTVLGSFNNWNIIQFNNKRTPIEYFDALHKVFLDGISDNIASLLQLDQYDATNESYPTTMGYYVIKYLSEPYKLQENRTIYGKVSKAG